MSVALMESVIRAVPPRTEVTFSDIASYVWNDYGSVSRRTIYRYVWRQVSRRRIKRTGHLHTLPIYTRARA